jgi:hypothetical protein
MFSYPVAGGLWLDSPHAFLEELIHIIPSLRLLSNVPSYLRSQRGRKDNKNSRESKNNQLPKSGVRWDWPKVVHQVERTLAKATMCKFKLTIKEKGAFNFEQLSLPC